MASNHITHNIIGAFGNSGNGKLKWKTEIVEMKIANFLIHTSLKKTTCKTRPLEL